MIVLEYRLRSKGENKCVVISDARFRNELDLITSMGGKIPYGCNEVNCPSGMKLQKRKSITQRKIMETKYRDVVKVSGIGSISRKRYNKNDGSRRSHKDVLTIQQDIYKEALKLV